MYPFLSLFSLLFYFIIKSVLQKCNKNLQKRKKITKKY
nr:MAG TPA: ATP synthase subunit 9 [Caudoviricetes sp.]